MKCDKCTDSCKHTNKTQSSVTEGLVGVLGPAGTPEAYNPKGWICPVCGRGVAPWVSVCPCQPTPITITYGSGTGKNYDNWLTTTYATDNQLKGQKLTINSNGSSISKDY